MKLQKWWDYAQRSGKVQFGTLESLLKRIQLRDPEFTMVMLQSYLKTEVETLKDWWRLIGRLIYGEYPDFANDLNTLVPEQRRIKPSSISDWIVGRRTPAFVEWQKALFAFTALSMYAGGSQIPPPKLPQPFQSSAQGLEVFQALTLLDKAKTDLLVELSEIWPKNLSAEDRRRIRSVVLELLDGLRGIGEDQQAIEEIGKIFS